MSGDEFIVLVCGGRDFYDRDTLNKVLDFFHKKYRITKIVNGGAKGADKLATEWSVNRQVPYQEYPADWSQGKGAGLIRNSQMLQAESINLVIAFPGGNGTKDMVSKANHAKIEVIEVKLKINLRSSFLESGSSILDRS